MTEAETLERADKARKILESPLYQEGYELVRQAIIAKWEQTPIRDRDGAHELKLMMRLLADVRANMEQAVRDGKVVIHREAERQRFSLFRRGNAA